MPVQPANSRAKANVSLLIETMYAVAANPQRWDQIIDALDGAPPSCSTRRPGPPGTPARLPGRRGDVEATDRLWANMRDSFGLTPAETRLAARLEDGLTLKEAAAELGVTINTVRNQLRAVFEKVGLSRQSDLIRALTQVSSLAGSLQDTRGRVPRLEARAADMWATGPGSGRLSAGWPAPRRVRPPTQVGSPTST